MPDSRQPPVASIVVLARHDPQRLRRCLAALARLDDQVSREVIVFLNGADDDVGTELTAPRAPLRVLRSRVNLGFAGGCNRASAQATGRYLVFLNDDAEVETGWLQGLVQVAEASPAVGAVGSCVLFPDGSVQEAGAVVWQDGSITPLGRGAHPESPAVSFVRDVDYCSACSLLVRRDAWAVSGGFCEEYFPAYYEDVDLCLSLRAHGYRVRYAPQSRVRHDGGGSTDPRYRRFLNDLHKRRFRQRWENVLVHFEPANPASAAAIRRAAFRASGRLRRLLVITGRLTGSPAASARRRMFDAIVELSEAGYAVSLWTPDDPGEIARRLGAFGVETIAEPLEQHVSDPGVLYDTILVSQPAQFDRFAAMLRRSQPHSVLVYDADAVHHERLTGRESLAGGADRAALAAEAQSIRAVETSLRARADFLTCGSSAEEAFLRSTSGTAPITVVPGSSPDARFGRARHVTAQFLRTHGLWIDAMRQAQFGRTARRPPAAGL